MKNIRQNTHFLVRLFRLNIRLVFYLFIYLTIWSIVVYRYPPQMTWAQFLLRIQNLTGKNACLLIQTIFNAHIHPYKICSFIHCIHIIYICYITSVWISRHDYRSCCTGMNENSRPIGAICTSIDFKLKLVAAI